MTLLMLVGLFMMLVVLIQRGRGGGLAGAFGGAGGSSAFGTKAGDVFTKITVVVAIIWFALAGFSGIALRNRDSNWKGGSNVEEKTDDADKAGDDDTPPTKSAGEDDGPIPKLNLPDDPKPPELPALPVTPAAGEMKLDLDAGDAADAEKTEGEKVEAEQADGDENADNSDEKAEGSADGDDN